MLHRGRREEEVQRYRTCVPPKLSQLMPRFGIQGLTRSISSLGLYSVTSHGDHRCRNHRCKDHHAQTLYLGRPYSRHSLLASSCHPCPCCTHLMCPVTWSHL